MAGDLLDVLIVGAGPAGSVAATVLARAGISVRLVDRAASFPREKLCGDTVNPGTLARLRRLQMSAPIEEQGLPVEGMVVTGPGGATIRGHYPQGLSGRSMSRSDLDWSLLQHAIRAGAEFEPNVTVRRALVADVARSPGVRGAQDGTRVEGVTTPAGPIRARVTIAADGRRSTIAFGLGLSRHPASPRRWAIGAYFENVTGSSSTGATQPTGAMGEMHVRRGYYIGVAPLAGGVTNVCLVVDAPGHDFRDPAALLRTALANESILRDRFANARLVRPPTVLGPLAVDAVDRSIDGLLLAGDAAGFIDPMTGDGLRFAVRGGELAAEAALDALAHGWPGVHERLSAARRAEFASKWRFNRTLRAMVGSPVAMIAAGIGARAIPGVVERLVARAGDCALAQA